MLHRQGYRRWVQHKGAIRALTLNSFPKIRESPRSLRVADLLGVLSAHFELERSWAGHRLAQQEHCSEVGLTYL